MAVPTPAQLKADVETALTAANEVLAVANDLPLPASVKDVLIKVEAVLADVKSFLDAA